MIEAKNLILKLEKNNINFFCGVPDSILKNFTNYLENYKKKKHLICANEGGAVGLAIGNYLSSKKITCVYMQNSGLGNSVNPLVSVAHKKIYSIPMLLLIGWRGAPKLNDEAQHKKQGLITKEMLKLMDIKFLELRNKIDLKKIPHLIDYGVKNKTPVAIIVKKNVITGRNIQKKIKKVNVDRSVFINELLKLSDNKCKIVSSTGYISRDLFRLSNNNFLKRKNFYMIGGMGHAQMVAYGVANFSKNKIICLDGDGSIIMHLGSSPIFAGYNKNNLKYILLNNESHESVGGQFCISKSINFKKLSRSLGFKRYFLLKRDKNINNILNKFLKSKLNSFLEVKINSDNLESLPRIRDVLKVKDNFMSIKK